MRALRLLLLLALVAASAVAYRYVRLRFIPMQTHARTAGMGPFVRAAYTDRLHYAPGDSVHVFASTPSGQHAAHLVDVARGDTLATARFDGGTQATPPDASQRGVRWTRSFSLALSDTLRPGLYRLAMPLADGAPDTNTVRAEPVFAVGQDRAAEVVTIVPTATWMAYNAWGGQSLYRNGFAAETVYYVSAQRPNSAHFADHSTRAEANIHRWFADRYGANVVPDRALGTRPDLFARAKVVVLAAHVEYVSKEDDDALEALVRRGVSLVSLGANQPYWSIRWHDDGQRIECRKDMTAHDGDWRPGGLWRHRLRSEDRLLGVRYDPRGMGSFAPYRVLDAGHWLFAGTGVRRGDTFGTASLDGRPLSGIETDKVTRRMAGRTERIAQGLNGAATTGVFAPGDAAWDGSGGADLTVWYPTPTSAVLASGSIHSGAGLGYDRVFTSVIKTFMRRYGPSPSATSTRTTGQATMRARW